MRALEASELLQVWERGVGSAPARAIMPLLMAACPEIDPQRLPHLTIGERDALLLSQREWMFGPHLEATASCPTCGERLEFSLTIDGLRAVPPVTDASNLGQTVSGSAAVDAYQVEFRAPTIADTQRATNLHELLQRCLIRATRAGELQAINELPPTVIEAVSRQMADADPQANIELALNCPACGQEWSATFDIAAFLWQELHTWAQRTLLDIHQLAGAYGWSEAEILALSPARRQIYLTMIGAGE
jgi:hypothetical protein